MIKRKIYELELLRIVGAIAIVLYHLTYRRISVDGIQQQLFPAFEIVSQHGYLGVNLFFMISGFVILMSTINRTAINFAISRIDRLFPAYWAAVTATTICILILDVNSVSLKQYLFNLTMLNDYFDVKDIDGVYWTLHVEIKFYFLIFLCLLFKQLKNIKFWLSIWLICCVSYAVFKQPFFMGWLISPFYSSYFIAGMSFFLIRQNGLSVSTASLAIVSFFISLFNISHQVGQGNRM